MLQVDSVALHGGTDAGAHHRRHGRPAIALHGRGHVLDLVGEHRLGFDAVAPQPGSKDGGGNGQWQQVAGRASVADSLLGQLVHVLRGLGAGVALLKEVAELAGVDGTVAIGVEHGPARVYK